MGKKVVLKDGCLSQVMSKKQEAVARRYPNECEWNAEAVKVVTEIPGKEPEVIWFSGTIYIRLPGRVRVKIVSPGSPDFRPGKTSLVPLRERETGK